MIEFYGPLSDTNLIEINKRKNKNAAAILFVFLVIISTVTIVLGVLKFVAFYYFLCMTIGFALISILIFVVPAKSVVFRLPLKIVITPQYVSYEVIGTEISKKKSITSVKKVVKFGDLYYIIFKFGDYNNSWICQKNLIVKGTIEEFEKMFEGKIIRNKNKRSMDE